MNSLFPLTHGESLPEVYHLSFNGTHFEVFVSQAYWEKFVKFASETQFPKNMGPTYVPPSMIKPTFGFHGCAEITQTFDGLTCLKVPALLVPNDEENPANNMRAFGETLSSIFIILNHLIYNSFEEKEICNSGDLPQLFALETFISHEARFHGAGFSFSISHRALKYLEALGIRHLPRAIESMEHHFFAQSRRDDDDDDNNNNRRLFRGSMECRLREYGTLHMHTVGNCACLGVMPRDFGRDGCGLSTHNVDTISQQFNLLVGISYVWQMVREGIHTGEPPSLD
ncbi:MAG: hypothetical protein M0P64_02150 [Candidatus Pacebacteria bacterium]|jgi:hypothetical protein|nr:hypothetical protein [Candidatus Paceibacterota bacterium]